MHPLDVLLEIDPALTPQSSTALTPSTTEERALAPTPPAAPLAELDHDVTYARENITDAINKVKQALDSAILLAQSGDSPRAFEVVGSMLTSIVAANKELVQLHQAKEDTVTTHQARTQPAGREGSVRIEKAVFVGKASDLLRELKALRQKSDAGEAAAADDAIDVTPVETDSET